MIVLFETADPDQSFGWSTMANFNALLDDRLRTPTIKSTETDWNRDGKLDWVDMTIEMPAEDHQAIYGVQLYLIFDVKLFVSDVTFFLLFFYLELRLKVLKVCKLVPLLLMFHHFTLRTLSGGRGLYPYVIWSFQIAITQ